MKTSSQQEMIRYLEQMRDFRNQLNVPFAYNGMEDYLLEHGRWYEPMPLPKDIRRGMIKQCFHNSFALAKRGTARYVEGVAISSIPIPLHHAWNTADGETVIDSTWNPVGTCYFGVEFPIAEVRAVLKNQCVMLDNWKDGHPLFQGPRMEGLL